MRVFMILLSDVAYALYVRVACELEKILYLCNLFDADVVKW